MLGLVGGFPAQEMVTVRPPLLELLAPADLLSRFGRRLFEKFRPKPTTCSKRTLVPRTFVSELVAENFSISQKNSPREEVSQKNSLRFAPKRNLILLEGGDSRSVGNSTQ